MIALFLTAIDSHANQREFNCWLPSIESQFDFLNSIVAQGDTLLSAYLVENSSRTDLPIAAFDGVPMTIGIRALEKEWKSSLSLYNQARFLHYQELIELTRRRLDIYQVNIATCERMVDCFKGWLHAQEGKVLTTTRSYLINHYQDQLTAYQIRLAKGHFGASLMTSRLNRLLA